MGKSPKSQRVATRAAKRAANRAAQREASQQATQASQKQQTDKQVQQTQGPSKPDPQRLEAKKPLTDQPQGITDVAGRSGGDQIIAENLARILRLRGISETELGRRLGLSPQAVNQWVHAQTEPTPRRLRQIAEALSIDETELWRDFSKVGNVMPLREIDSGMLEVVMDDQSKPKLNLNLAKHGGWVLRADRIPGIALSTSDLMLLNVRQNLLDPDLRRGDLALVDLAWRVLSQSGIYLVVLGGFAHLRRCIVMPSSKEDSVLVSDNRSQSNVPIGNVTVIGRLIGKLGLEVEW